MSFLAELRQSSRLAVGVAASAATVGAIYGYDSSNIAGALLYLTPEFGLTADTQGLVTTAVVIGEIAGALFGGTLANRLGRKPVMVGVAATFALFSLLSGLAWSVPSLIVARLLLGLTIGVSVVVAPVFIAESAPQRIRGSLLVMYQVATVTGIILGYLIAWGLAESGNWRVMLGAAAIPGALITLALLRLPDTPRWYMMKGRVDEARTVLREIEPDRRHRGRAGRHPGRAERGARRRGDPRDAAQALPAGRDLRDRPRLLRAGHRHQRDRLLQPADLRGDGLHRQRRHPRPARAGPGGRPARGVLLGRPGRPARPAADPAHRHRRSWCWPTSCW